MTSSACRQCCALFKQVILNGDAEARYAGNLNLSFAYVEVRITSSNRLL
jgi:hypothetical protein